MLIGIVEIPTSSYKPRATRSQANSSSLRVSNVDYNRSGIVIAASFIRRGYEKTTSLLGRFAIL
jgi:hypothetical protein